LQISREGISNLLHGSLIAIEVALAVELAPVLLTSVLHDDFEGAGGGGSSFTGDDDAGNLPLEEPLDLAEAGGVASGTTVGDVDDLGGHWFFGSWVGFFSKEIAVRVFFDFREWKSTYRKTKTSILVH